MFYSKQNISNHNQCYMQPFPALRYSSANAYIHILYSVLYLLHNLFLQFSLPLFHPPSSPLLLTRAHHIDPLLVRLAQLWGVNYAFMKLAWQHALHNYYFSSLSFMHGMLPDLLLIPHKYGKTHLWALFCYFQCQEWVEVSTISRFSPSCGCLMCFMVFCCT